MRAAVLQVVFSSLFFFFGVQALRVWRRFGTVRRERAALAWGVTAAQFLLVGGTAVVHSLLAAASMAQGKSSRLFHVMSDWGPPLGAGRGVASVVFGVLLVALLVVHRRHAPRVAQAAPVVLVMTLLAGTAAGWALSGTTTYSFSTMLAVLNAATAVVLMAALLAAVQNDGLDQLLWLALAVFALKETITVSLLAVIAVWGISYVLPYYSAYFWLHVVLGGVMVGIGARRLHLAGGGRRVPALFERLHAMRRPTQG
jgi:hypothetical protein